MATAKDIIKAALRYCGEQTNHSIAPDEDYADGLAQLNQLVEMWFELGLELAASQNELTSVNNQFNFPAFSRSAFQYNLAVELWPFYNIEKPMPMSLMSMAESSKDQLFSIASQEVSSVFPGNLPQGMGNWFVYNYNYYPDCDADIYPCDDNGIVTEGSVAIVTEGGTPSE